MFLEISQNSQENTCARVSFLIKLQPATLLKKRLWHRPATLSKKRLWYRCFPVNFVKFLRTPFTEHLWTTATLFFSYLFSGSDYQILPCFRGSCSQVFQKCIQNLVKHLGWTFLQKQFTTDRSTVNYFLKKLHLRQGYGHTSAFYKLDVSKSLNDLQENTSIIVNL